MNTESYQRIADNAELIQEFAQAPKLLRDIAKRSQGDDKKHLRAIAVTIEEMIRRGLLIKAVDNAIQTYQLLSLKNNVGYEQASAHLGLSYSSAQQVVSALKQGGIDFKNGVAKGSKKPSPKGGRPRVGKTVKDGSGK